MDIKEVLDNFLSGNLKSLDEMNNLGFSRFSFDNISMFMRRSEIIPSYGFALPSSEIVLELSQHKLIEVGAGTGFFAKLVSNMGGDIIASDPSIGYDGHLVRGLHFDIETLEAVEAVLKYSDRDVFMSWPCYDKSWAYETALKISSGRKLFLISEGMGGCCADDNLFDYLKKNFQHINAMNIPNWPGINDRMDVFLKN